MALSRMMVFAVIFLILVTVLLVFRPWNSVQTDRMLTEAHQTPLSPPVGALSVYHLGHSLVGRDMPAMLEQLAGPGHSHASQLGWGASLRDHWDPKLDINGFEVENDHPRFEPAHEAIGSGQYDVVVLTEMVELRDAIRYQNSPKYKRAWADLARRASPDTRVYLYETWHTLDDPAGFLDRLDTDYADLWRGKLLRGDIRASGPERATRVIPAGQVMAALIRKIDAEGAVGNLTDRTDLFARNDDGTQDMIHLSDLGNYLVALTHYAVLYQRSPVGLPHDLTRADGSPATAPTPEAAALMQQTVWEVVTRLPETGVPAS